MNIDTEHWKPTHIFPKEYLISDKGELYSVRTDKLLKYTTDNDGYRYYVLCVAGERHTVKAHRLVAMAFVPNPDGKPALDYINGNRQDNNASNLRWVTNKENSNNPITLKKLRENGIANMPKLIEASAKRGFGSKSVAVYQNDVLLGEFRSQRQAADYCGMSEGKLSSCLSGIKKSCKGYTFKRIDNKIWL